MRMARLTAPLKIEVIQTAEPEPVAAAEARVRVRYVGICGTDMHIFAGERSDVRLPRVMGHELSGVVLEVGMDVNSISVGDRVVFDPVMACGQCEVCKKGHANVCPDVKCYGVQMDGAFQDEIVVPAAQLYKIPDRISMKEAALAEPFSIAANILDRASVRQGEKIVIIGVGTIGLCLIQAAKGMGATVFASDVADSKLAKAKEFGADVAINSNKDDIGSAVAAFAPNGADVLIDAVGITPILEQCIKMPSPASRIVVISFDSTPASVLPVEITKKELSIVGSRMNAKKFPHVIEWLEKDKIKPAGLISKVFPVERIQEAFETALSDKSLLKVLISFSENEE